jgi:hypothetical protein
MLRAKTRLRNGANLVYQNLKSELPWAGSEKLVSWSGCDVKNIRSHDWLTGLGPKTTGVINLSQLCIDLLETRFGESRFLNLFNRWFYETSNQPRKVLWLSTS